MGLVSFRLVVERRPTRRPPPREPAVAIARWAPVSAGGTRLRGEGWKMKKPAPVGMTWRAVVGRIESLRIRCRDKWFLHDHMTRNGGVFHPTAALREPAQAFTAYRNGRKRDKLFLLPRASYPPRNRGEENPPRTRNPAEPEASLSPHALRFPPGSFLTLDRTCLGVAMWSIHSVRIVESPKAHPNSFPMTREEIIDKIRNP